MSPPARDIYYSSLRVCPPVCPSVLLSVWPCVMLPLSGGAISLRTLCVNN